ncbi:unnamed protein product [Leuciscus chuanchicus]
MDTEMDVHLHILSVSGCPQPLPSPLPPVPSTLPPPPPPPKNLTYLRFDQPVTPTPTPPPTQLHLIPTPPGQGTSLAFHNFHTFHTFGSSHFSPITSPDGLYHIPSTDPPCLPLSFTAVQVRQVLRKIKGRKAAGPDGISSRLLKSSADQLSAVMERIYNLSLKLGVVPQLWKTSCVVPVPKTSHPKDLNSYRPVALTSHLMKTLERLVLQHLRSTVGPSMDPVCLQAQHRGGGCCHLPAASCPRPPGEARQHCKNHVF